jgi:hypothetical protein
MGLWNLLKNINNAEGTRETMRRSYDKAFNLVVKSGLSPSRDLARHLALFDALETRYVVRSVIPCRRLILLLQNRLDELKTCYPASGISMENAEKLIWAELLPFLYLDKQTAREALAEYVVYKEMPKDAKISWLEGVVQRGCELAKNKKEYNAWMPVAKTNGAVWVLLFEGRGNDYFW